MRKLFATIIVFVLGVGNVLAEPPTSGLRVGDEVSAWEPIHVAGPHAATKICPVCTYLDAPVLLAFAKDISAAADLAKLLEEIAKAHAKGKLKVVLVVISGSDEQLKKFAKDHSIQTLMLCRPDPERQEKQLKAYKVDPSVTNTIMLYQDYLVKKNWAALATTKLAELKTETDAYLPKR
jgi:hypothetical protein